MDADKGKRDDRENAKPDDTSRRPAPRTATDMAPGIPAGSGKGIDEALQQPDTDLGGGVAGDTTPGVETPDKPARDTVRNDDRDRTTL